eukprot:452123-Prymnesium_polylepis.3
MVQPIPEGRPAGRASLIDEILCRRVRLLVTKMPPAGAEIRSSSTIQPEELRRCAEAAGSAACHKSSVVRPTSYGNRKAVEIMRLRPRLLRMSSASCTWVVAVQHGARWMTATTARTRAQSAWFSPGATSPH